jgi:hypothetical protein
MIEELGAGIGIYYPLAGGISLDLDTTMAPGQLSHYSD